MGDLVKANTFELPAIQILASRDSHLDGRVDEFLSELVGRRRLRRGGGDVIKVEDTGMGDYVRRAPPHYEGAEMSASKCSVPLSLNRGKRSIRIDLKSSAGKDVLAETGPLGRRAARGDSGPE